MNYRPLQTQLNFWHENQLFYRESLPSRHLKNVVSYYSTLTSRTSINHTYFHKIIPGGCVNLIFSLSDSSNVHGFVTGPLKNAEAVPLTSHIHNIGICFLPDRAKHFLGCDVNELSHKPIFLSELLGDSPSHEIEEQLVPAQSYPTRLAIIEKFLERYSRADYQPEPMVTGALHIIYRTRGNIKISELAGQLMVSPRQLHRKFSTWLGLSPKEFCRIIRFQNTLKTIRTNPQANLLPTILDEGYYDQSHFIHEFASLYGSSPSASVNRTDQTY